MGLNLHFTQKDLPPPKLQDKGKKNGHIHDVCHLKCSFAYLFMLNTACLFILVSAKNDFAFPEGK
jgi:hypothetical protein